MFVIMTQCSYLKKMINNCICIKHRMIRKLSEREDNCYSWIQELLSLILLKNKINLESHRKKASKPTLFHTLAAEKEAKLNHLVQIQI